jgi:hypothetical protein
MRIWGRGGTRGQNQVHLTVPGTQQAEWIRPL